MRIAVAGPQSRGYTVIEILVALAIVGLLAAIAVSSYSSYIVRGQRSAAKAALVRLAQGMERYYTACGSYSTANVPANCTGAAPIVNYPLTPLAGSTCVAVSPAAPGNATYCITGTATASQSNGPPTSQFLLTATPCAEMGACPAPANNSFDDAQCGPLTLDNAGNRGAANNTAATNPGLVAQCWQL